MAESCPQGAMQHKNQQVPVVRFLNDELRTTVKYARNIFESTCVLVGNMFGETTVTDVQNIFVRFGDIKHLKMYESNGERCKRYALVYFEDKDSAENARKQLHLNSHTKLTYKNSRLTIRFVDTVKKGAKWYNFSAIASGECLYWRVWGKCEYNKKRSRFNHYEICKAADSHSYLRKTLELEGFGPDSKKNCEIVSPKIGPCFFDDLIRLNYEHLIRNVLRIEWPFKDTVSEEVLETKAVETCSANWDSDDDVFITRRSKERVDVPWPWE